MYLEFLPNELVYAGVPMKKAGAGKYLRCVNYAERICGGVVELFLGNVTASGPDWFTVCVAPDTTVAEIWCGSRLLPLEERRVGNSVLVGPLQWYGTTARALGAWTIQNRSTGTVVKVRADGSGLLAEDSTGVRFHISLTSRHNGYRGKVGDRVRFTRGKDDIGRLALSVSDL